METLDSASASLYRDLKQSRPFRSLEEALLLSLLMCSQRMSEQLHRILKTENLSDVQYNILRILRGAGEEGRSCGQISERLVTRVPDVTRLLDRLEARELVRRERSSSDRRVVLSYATPRALTLLEKLDPLVSSGIRRSMEHLDEKQRLNLLASLERLREGLK